MSANPVISFVTRGPLRESAHRGCAALARAGGRVALFGDAQADMFPRSALKPFQALPLLEERLDETFGLTAREIALLSASHGGDFRHIAALESMLRKLGIDEGMLRCGSHPPYDPAAAEALVRAARAPRSLHHNCSGKHAAMLALARAHGAPLETYLEPGHPVQQRIASTIALFCGSGTAAPRAAADGCGAPAFVLSVRSLAIGFVRLAEPAGLAEGLRSACARLLAAAAEEPHFLSGRRRLDLAAMSAGGESVFCKSGAEGVVALAIRRAPAPFALAVKIDDGAQRGLGPPVWALLEALGADLAAAREHWPPACAPEVRTHRGATAGELRVSEEFVDWLQGEMRAR